MILYMLFSSYSQPVTFIEFWLYPNKLHYHNLGGGIGGNCNNSGDHMRDELVVCLVLRIATITTPPLLLHFHPPLHVASLVVVAQHTTCILALGMIPECWQRGYRAPNSGEYVMDIALMFSNRVGQMLACCAKMATLSNPIKPLPMLDNALVITLHALNQTLHGYLININTCPSLCYTLSYHNVHIG